MPKRAGKATVQRILAENEIKPQRPRIAWEDVTQMLTRRWHKSCSFTRRSNSLAVIRDLFSRGSFIESRGPLWMMVSP